MTGNNRGDAKHAWKQSKDLISVREEMDNIRFFALTSQAGWARRMITSWSTAFSLLSANGEWLQAKGLSCSLIWPQPDLNLQFYTAIIK
jgi:hypothetical protein